MDFKHLKNVEISKYSSGLEVTKISTLALLKYDAEFLDIRREIRQKELEEIWSKPFDIDCIDIDLSFKTKSYDEVIKYLNHSRSLRRTKNNLFEIGNENRFDSMVTITFSSIYDRTNIDLFRELVNNGCKKLKRKYPDFKYYLVPEYHPNSKAIHLHGAISGLPESEYKRAINPKTNNLLYHNGRAVFNIPAFSHIGHTTAVMITQTNENLLKVTNYLVKYITKDIEQSPVDDGDKRYWSSQGLLRPHKEEYFFTESEIQNYIESKKNAYVKTVDKSLTYTDKNTGEIITKNFVNYYIVHDTSNNA